MGGGALGRHLYKTTQHPPAHCRAGVVGSLFLRSLGEGQQQAGENAWTGEREGGST